LRIIALKTAWPTFKMVTLDKLALVQSDGNIFPFQNNYCRFAQIWR